MIFRRLGSFLYDAFILFALIFFLTAFCLALRQGDPIASGTLWFQLSILFLIYFYFSVSCTFGGQTIGMRAWKIRLVSLSGSLHQKQILLRFCFVIPGIVYGLLRFRNPERILQGWTKTKYVGMD